MFIKVVTLLIILELTSAQRLSKCCSAQNNEISTGSTGGSVVKSLEILRLHIENVKLKVNIQDKGLFSMKQKVDDLTGVVFPKDSCAHLVKIFTNLSQSIHCVNTQTFASCAEALKKTNQSGVYDIQLPNSKLKPFKVYCEKTDGDDNWMIVQRRQDGSVDFYRKWKDYKKGFGNIAGEFFIGLDRLHELTQSREHELWFKLQYWNNETRSAYYSKFAILGEKDYYKTETLGTYSGDAGDSFTEQYGHNFSTNDMDNDNHTKYHCARLFHGAWWFSWCGVSHLNGYYFTYGELTSINQASGLFWFSWPGPLSSLKYAHMALRPVE